MANVVVWNERDDFSLTPLGWQEETGCHVFLAKGGVYAYHKVCDNSQSGSAWHPADDVFKSDQRYKFEKAADGESDDAETRDGEETE